MFRFLLRRLVTIFFSLFFIVTLTFFMMKAIPGGPFTREKALPPQIEQAINEKFHLDDPVETVRRLSRTYRSLSLGPSFKYQYKSVNDIISDYFPVSAQLGATAILLSLVVGLSAGTISALKQTKSRTTAPCSGYPVFLCPQLRYCRHSSVLFSLSMAVTAAGQCGIMETHDHL